MADTRKEEVANKAADDTSKKPKVNKGFLEDLHNYDPYIYSNTAKNWVYIMLAHILFFAGCAGYFILIWACIFTGNQLACYAMFGILFLISLLYVIIGSIVVQKRGSHDPSVLEKVVVRNNRA
jgi:predicted exporter